MSNKCNWEDGKEKELICSKIILPIGNDQKNEYLTLDYFYLGFIKEDEA